MKKKWLKYYEKIEEIYLVGCILDPRFRTELLLTKLLNVYYDQLFPENNVIVNIDSNAPPPPVKPNVDLIILQVTSTLHAMFDEYVSEMSGSQNLQVNRESTDTSNMTTGQRLVFERLKRPRPLGSSSNLRLELDQYLTIRFDFPHDEDLSAFSKFDILDWWKSKSSTFPIMSMIAEDVLACPVSTVAVEAAFSIAGHILDQRISNLRPENLEAQVCSDNYIGEKTISDTETTTLMLMMMTIAMKLTSKVGLQLQQVVLLLYTLCLATTSEVTEGKRTTWTLIP
ncbi:PREDICTED: zinc finger BED domain-containing protein DAYSLEEPER-like [Erythranthe guttata]|uniref:zinc finger BED domain-containing protein DAYSLEEPER-like n=1 Tax=Erythranthe guttata TaxID=4155 RepID=UPI00064DD7AF|nr:PREDICTED: zinc finger BED domain-containing protein DAYSLEEPER-like [Erythranthe guttata]|eukprot:XP_012851526.1 PREDICTED: zinc finger BED domain-containing protein DAYSLEEPER-like [Erythranthe guttata]